MDLFSFYRSSAVYRVRIALNLKHLHYNVIPVHLQKDGGQQYKDSFKEINPQSRVPVLCDENNIITQSFAILEYLEEKYPAPPLLPEAIELRAQIRAFSQAICCDIHPLNNIRVLGHLREKFGADDAGIQQWMSRWISEGFESLEQLIEPFYTGQFCFGDQPTFADCCLIPQYFNALRFNVSVNRFQKLKAIYTHCNTLEAFQKAAPHNQIDAE